jgi:sulfatase maturation enzyme AslB (radical SAM superfamily)
MEPVLHINDPRWLKTPAGDDRGYIQPNSLRELWFHTGTICNLSCPFCLEGSKPGDDRLGQITREDIVPFVAEALGLGVEKFSFTGGEPFVNKHMIAVLEHCLRFRPCMVLTNATRPLLMRLDEIKKLKQLPYPLHFRVSIDHPDRGRHDAGRGHGNFDLALQGAKELHAADFRVSLARQREKGEDVEAKDGAFVPLLRKAGLPCDIAIVSFPDFLTPGVAPRAPHITRDCMTRYHTEESRGTFMCAFSKMIVKRNGQMRVYACTLVDDDEDYDVGASLKEAMAVRIMMKHQRCYACFAHGASCSET